MQGTANVLDGPAGFPRRRGSGIISSMEPLTGVEGCILAGGRSTRMGRDKALLPFGGRPLLEHMLEVAASVVAPVRIAGDPQALAYADVLPDAFAGQGPLAGIHTALRASRAPFTLVLAVDMPFLSREFLRFLVTQAQGSAALVTAPRLEDGWQPLCAVYRAEFLPHAERALQAGRNRVDALYAEMPVQEISAASLQERGFTADLFRNLNTPQDWDAAQAELQERAAP